MHQRVTVYFNASICMHYRSQHFQQVRTLDIHEYVSCVALNSVSSSFFFSESAATRNANHVEQRLNTKFSIFYRLLSFPDLTLPNSSFSDIKLCFYFLVHSFVNNFVFCCHKFFEQIRSFGDLKG